MALHALPMVLVVVSQAGRKSIKAEIPIGAFLNFWEHVVQVHEIALALICKVIDELRVIDALSRDVVLDGRSAYCLLNVLANVGNVTGCALLKVDCIVLTVKAQIERLLSL